MENLMTWQEIQKLYDHRWVQLIDYDWPEGEPFPRSGRVQAHAPSRKELNSLLMRLERPQDAAWIYVGDPDVDKKTIISCNSTKLTICD